MKIKKTHIFVTGASGFLGKNFIIRAANKGHKIFALSRSKKKNNLKNIFWIKGEIDNEFKKYLKRSHTMIHFSAAGVNNKSISFIDAIKENVIRPYRFLIDCIQHGCKKWIIIGSASEYGLTAKSNRKLDIRSKQLPESNYEKSKLLFSKIALNLSKIYKINCRLMRVFNVYGKGENKQKLLSSLQQAIKKNKQFTITSSKQEKDFIEIDKVSDVLIDTLNFKKNSKNFPQIWHVASGNSMTIKNFVISKINKKSIKNIIFKNNNKTIRHFKSSKKSIWKI